jgi:hypothetical protein
MKNVKTYLSALGNKILQNLNSINKESLLVFANSLDSSRSWEVMQRQLGTEI